MNYKVDSTSLPTEKELKTLFAQTSWAADRQENDIGRMLQQVSVFVTIRDDARLIGFGRALTDGVYRALLDDIIVDSNYHKMGLGKVIVEQLMMQLQGIEEVFLNAEARLEGFYQKFGFATTSTIAMKR